MSTEHIFPMTVVHTWSVYRCHYTARRPDQRIKVGDRNFFEASSLQEVVEKLNHRGVYALDPEVSVTRIDHTETIAEPVVVNLTEDQEPPPRIMTRRDDTVAERLRARLREYDDTLETPGQAQDIAETDLLDDVRALVQERPS